MYEAVYCSCSVFEKKELKEDEVDTGMDMEADFEGEKYDLTPGTKEAHDYMWSIEGTTLELTWNYGTETDADQKYHPGNEEKDGFGHVAFNTDDVYAACKMLEEKGVTFKKKPDEGRMPGIAFAYDPDGYW